MKRINHIIRTVVTISIVGLSLSSCVYDDGVDSDKTISINAMVSNESRTVSTAASNDDSFVVLFWLQDQLEQLTEPENNPNWANPYLEKIAPQAVPFYNQTVYDTGYPYPYPDTKLLYATGYSPATVLTSDDNHRILNVNIPEENANKLGRYDLLGCDVWSNVYKGSQSDPFAQDKNKLYFRHLAAKLVFYAERDKETMENKQYVRNVEITNLQMSIDGGNKWTSMFTPKRFEWKKLDSSNDFTEAYKSTIRSVNYINGISNTDPEAGYKIVETQNFVNNFVLTKNASDRVPIDGMVLDSCYVCNPIIEEKLQSGTIQLKMDISAELSFDPNFPKKDGDGSITDDLTFKRTWKDVLLESIKVVDFDDKGNAIATDTPVTEFKPGNEYRVYIKFHRTGVNLVAKELPWNYGGIHYITIQGGEIEK